MSAGASFATGLLNSLNKNFERSRQEESDWRKMKMQHFLTNTVPNYREDQRKAKKIQSMASVGTSYLTKRKGLDQEKAQQVAYAYAGKYDNLVDYRKALAQQIAGPLDEQTQNQQREEPVVDSEDISEYRGYFENDTPENREALRYDLAENMPQTLQNLESDTYIDEMRMQGGQAQGEAPVDTTQEQTDEPHWFSTMILGNPDYAQASEEAYEELSRMTGYSPGMIKLMEMGQSPLSQIPQGSFEGVRFNEGGGDLEGLESQIHQNWGDLPEENRTAYQVYQQSGDVSKLYEAAAGLPASDASTDYIDQLKEDTFRKVQSYMQQNPDATLNDMNDLPADDPYHLTMAQIDLYNREILPSLNDMIVGGLRGQGGLNMGGGEEGGGTNSAIADQVQREVEGPGGAGDDQQSNLTIEDREAVEIAEDIYGSIDKSTPSEERRRIYKKYTEGLTQQDKALVARKIEQLEANQ